MKDSLCNLRKLPKNILNIAGRLIVNRQGTSQDSFMRTEDILGYIRPNDLYEIVDTSTPENAQSTRSYALVNRGALSADDPWKIRLDASKQNPPLPPPHVCIDGQWDKEEFIKVTNANILGGLGTFTLSSDGSSIQLPVILATNESLAFYDAYLVPIGQRLAFESENNLPYMSINVGETYVKQYLMEPDYGHGAYLEYHNQPHFWLPLSADAKGFIIFGKEIDGKYLLTGFEIPFGCAVYMSPYTLHADSFLSGEYICVYTVASDYSTVILKNKQGELVAFSPMPVAVSKENDSLLLAASEGDCETVNRLLKTEEVQQSVANSDNAALRAAASHGHLEIVNSLLNFEKVQELVDTFENGALALSCKNGHIDIVNRLLEFETVRNNVAAANNKALLWAASNGHLEIVQRLMEFDEAKKAIADRDNEIFREVVKQGHFDIMNFILKFNEVKNNAAIFNNEALLAAVANGYLEIVKRLLELESVKKQVSTDCDNKELLWVVKNGHLDVVNRLLQEENILQNIAALDNQLLRNVAANDYLDILDRLLQFPEVRDNIAASENEALIEASANGFIDIVDRLLEFSSVKKQVCNWNIGALCGAAKNGHLNIVSRLLIIDAVKNNVAANNNAAFREAVMNNHPDIVSRLLICPEVAAFEKKYKFQEEWAMLNK